MNIKMNYQAQLASRISELSQVSHKQKTQMEVQRKRFSIFWLE